MWTDFGHGNKYVGSVGLSELVERRRVTELANQAAVISGELAGLKGLAPGGVRRVDSELRRLDEAERYAELARRCWSKADSQRLEAELTSMRGQPVTAASARRDR